MPSEILPDYENSQSSVLMRLLNSAGARRVLAAKSTDTGLADVRPFPFIALVGQLEMRVALLLSLINPAINGVLLIGPRGTGKTTAVRSLIDILPDVEISDCEEGVLPRDLEHPHARQIYPDCYEKFHQGESISHYEPTRIVELPLNARLEDVVGGVNERVAVQQNRIKLERGILGRADGHLLYIDEVNLLPDEIIDAILDASAQGMYTVRRGAMVGTYRARFVLLGSMNPEEGRLRPQILDRFGLRVNVRGITDNNERLMVYNRVKEFRDNPYQFYLNWAEETAIIREEITRARARLPHITITEDALTTGIELVSALSLDSHRAEYTMFEAARANAAADDRTEAGIEDIRAVAPLALRQRQSEFMNQFFEQQEEEDAVILGHMDRIIGKKS